MVGRMDENAQGVGALPRIRRKVFCARPSFADVPDGRSRLLCAAAHRPFPAGG